MPAALLIFCSSLVFSITGTPLDAVSLGPGDHILSGAVNTGVFVRDGVALLIDCGEDVTPEALARLGVARVEVICMTQHRRPNAMGAYRFVEEQDAAVIVSEKDRGLFEETDAYWSNWKNRWHLYQMQPGPQVLPKSLKVSRTVKKGDTIDWRGLKLSVIDTPGATEGAVSYIADVEGTRLAFIGDVMYGSGQVLDLFSLQKGFRRVGDYHGFLGMREPLIQSLDTVAAMKPDLAIPSHGTLIKDFDAAQALLKRRLDALFRNYVSISAVNYYFPSQFEELKDDPARMPAAEQPLAPVWVRRVAYTSFAVMSESGDALLIDCGHDSVLSKLDEWKKEGSLKNVEGCWVTHYHDDHVDSLFRLASRDIPIMCDARMADVIEHPVRYHLPAISATPAPVARKTADGESWQWREFTLTAFHFPGQTLYHGGLLVDGYGSKVFFAGDSGAPSGLDDYCAANRTFLGPDKGSRRCLELWRRIQPDFIINQHQGKSFRFSDAQLDYMEKVLVERESMIAELTPWSNPNFAVDEHWIRAFPYEQDAAPGEALYVDVHVTNHGDAATIAVWPLLPKGWVWLKDQGTARADLAPHTDGWVTPDAERPDGVLSLKVQLPGDVAPGVYSIPLSFNFGPWKLSAYRHVLIRVR